MAESDYIKDVFEEEGKCGAFLKMPFDDMAAHQRCGGDTMLHSFVQDYAEKIFYFCLKKTGNAYEAEDLASDIFLNVFSALKKGTVPEHFPAWVWQIARNRYSRWVDKKHKQSASTAGADIGEYEIEDKTAGPEEALIRSEQLSLLRRELSFISSEYRNIVVAYYIQNKRISDIACALNLPKGTVTSRLYRARKILKEGMHMAREFGERSYHPETISFFASGNQPSGLPSSAIKRKIPVNILCEAHNNPCTVQELALELGIAAPYMEEEVEMLTKAELLKELDHGKYLTNFFIVPKECQNEINEIVCAFTEQHAAVFWHLAEKAFAKAVELGVATGDYSNNDACMFFAFYLEQQIEMNAFSSDLYYTKFKRNDGGNWGIIGFEQGSTRRLPGSFFNNNGNGWNGRFWDGYQAQPKDSVFGKRRYKEDIPNSYFNVTLEAIAKGVSLEVFSDTEKENLEKLIKKGFCIMRDDGSVLVNALVFKDDMKTRLNEYLKVLPEYQSLQEDMQECIAEAKKTVARYANPYLQEDFEYYVAMSVLSLRSTLSRLWKDNGFYTGDNAQFCAFYY